MDYSRSRHDVFVVDRQERIYDVIKESILNAAPVAVDLSAATTKCYFRAFDLPSGTLITEVTTDMAYANTGSDGIVDDRVMFTSAHGQIECRLVIVDEAVSVTGTITGFREEVWKAWLAEVRYSPQS